MAKLLLYKMKLNFKAFNMGNKLIKKLFYIVINFKI